MRMLLGNLVLAVAWAALTGQVTLLDLTFGFLVGYGVLWLARPVIGSGTYFRKVHRLVAFVLFFLRELIVANIRVAHDVVTPRLYSRPGVVAVPLDVRTDEEITLLGNLISLTPGTLSLDVSEDRRLLYIHAMFVESPDAVRREIKNGFERRVLEVMR